MGPQRPRPVAQPRNGAIVRPKIVKISQGPSGPKVAKVTPIVREQKMIKEGKEGKIEKTEGGATKRSIALSHDVTATMNVVRRKLNEGIANNRPAFDKKE